MDSQHPKPGYIDHLIDEVRQRRSDLLASCGDDLDALVRLIHRQELEHPARVADPRTVPTREGRSEE